LITRSNFVPFNYGITHPLGIPPHRARPSDTGYDLYLIHIHKVVGNMTIYGTGISVHPPGGYYFDLVPKNDIINTGYILANSVGIIDQSYTSEIMVPLVKLDPTTPDIILPIKLVQLIPRRWHCLTPNPIEF
jgi:dUTP pyrophosphatase